MAAAAGAERAEASVRLPGILLSSLMFEHLNSDCDVEGLIVGESVLQEQITINDSEADHIHIDEIYNVQKHIVCKKLHSFYTNTGEVDLDALKRILGDCKPESVIGWFKQRRNTIQQMTLREKSIHKSLKTTLSNPQMIFLLLTQSSFTSSGSTHKTEYAAYILPNREAVNVPVMVNNLGLHELMSYCRGPALCSAAGFNQTMDKHRSKFFSSSGSLHEVEEIDSMNDSLQSELDNLCHVVESTEKRLEALQREISSLRMKIMEGKQNKLLNENSDAPREPNKNVLLHNAIQALFGHSPLFQSQTLTTAAFPVLDFCCTLQTDAERETLTDQSQRPPEEHALSEVVQRGWTSRKRRTEVSLQGNDHKRTKT